MPTVPRLGQRYNPLLGVHLECVGVRACYRPGHDVRGASLLEVQSDHYLTAASGGVEQVTLVTAVYPPRLRPRATGRRLANDCVAATIRTDWPTRKTPVTSTFAKCGSSSTPRASRSVDAVHPSVGPILHTGAPHPKNRVGAAARSPCHPFSAIGPTANRVLNPC
jgi:hypothetical protein